MSKIWNSLGLAILGIALVMGCASAATTAGCGVDGCLLTDGYLELDATTLTASMSLGLLPAVAVAGGSLKVMAEPNYQITVKDDANLGTLANGATHLTDPLEVNAVALGTTTGVEVATGTSTTDCEKDTISIHYDQDLEPGDTTVGKYSIALTYTLAEHV